MNYYNEHEPFAAAWLRDLIEAGMIAPGHVDERSIEDVTPNDLRGYTQCHFFAGIGVWPFALRSVGWRDDRPIWTGSPPCQPFSTAGARGGFDDKRHLWPAYHWLIDQCHPPVIAGEQVASKAGLEWFDLVSTDLEGSGYAVGAADLCAAGVGVEWEESQAGKWLRRAIHDCPDPRIADQLRDFADWAGGELGDGGFHIRQRLYFMGVSNATRGRCGKFGDAVGAGDSRHANSRSDASSRLHHHHHPRPQRHAGDGSATFGRSEPERSVAPPSLSGGVADDPGERQEWGRPSETGDEPGSFQRSNGFRDAGGLDDHTSARHFPAWNGKPGEFEIDRGVGRSVPSVGCPINDAYSYNSGGRSADWLLCRDGRWRAVEPGTFPLVNGAPARVGRLRGYGNALDFRTVKAFAETLIEILA